MAHVMVVGASAAIALILLGTLAMAEDAGAQPIPPALLGDPDPFDGKEARFQSPTCTGSYYTVSGTTMYAEMELIKEGMAAGLDWFWETLAQPTLHIVYQVNNPNAGLHGWTEINWQYTCQAEGLYYRAVAEGGTMRRATLDPHPYNDENSADAAATCEYLFEGFCVLEYQNGAIQNVLHKEGDDFRMNSDSDPFEIPGSVELCAWGTVHNMPQVDALHSITGPTRTETILQKDCPTVAIQWKSTGNIDLDMHCAMVHSVCAPTYVECANNYAKAASHGAIESLVATALSGGYSTAVNGNYGPGGTGEEETRTGAGNQESSADAKSDNGGMAAADSSGGIAQASCNWGDADLLNLYDPRVTPISTVCSTQQKVSGLGRVAEFTGAIFAPSSGSPVWHGDLVLDGTRYADIQMLASPSLGGFQTFALTMDFALMNERFDFSGPPPAGDYLGRLDVAHSGGDTLTDGSCEADMFDLAII